MNFRFHPDAEIEFNHAIDYYEECQKNLGLEFAQEVYATIHRIIDFPDAWQPITEQTRRCLTNRFPFGIVYQKRNNEIIIIAIMHQHQKPFYWSNRS
ncbi:type II toxin-antitoxin system RelE/ParE family toxin [Sulfuricurvum sp. IAE1]|jgi:plasmid stabilization system protein ParE|uniref:type II toxin-antitoxin system RelE/ParE family toxin n=1 Tax=Sulfuricurvum sp. IAE1 TaxID=2546102 RepID=UPI0010443FCB|nr:type II toxin-antitoxin system RelE/ParE family toxin [Sulfuricurvum sp. IAE1]MDD3769282.1 type II toxin-antitoxin system RelE/ParE family toxin [Sulfuricurvum sp.]MDX9966026.1 type II toxin-antitoxin system RelE/ParE family toxin [Sulfuricurvum sp.]TDA69052.1 type II toxin-antitoxin system RelE/ParE family toxin [Sulfuricurvum sp. IAE1]